MDERMDERLVLDITGKTRKEFTKEVYGVLEKGIEDVFQSDRWRNWLIFCSSFHQYSAHNRMLIYLQMPGASLVAAMKDWNERGRTVIRGQGRQGLKIFAPTKFARWVEEAKRDEQGNVIYGADGKAVTEKVRKEVPGFVPVSVYDVSQTQGEPLPTLTPLLEGEYLKKAEVIAAIKTISTVPIFVSDFPGEAKGVFEDSMVGGVIRVKPGMSDNQTIKTMLHELAHSRLHSASANKVQKPREMEEFEAESIAFIVSNHLGIDTSSYSFAYLAGWSAGRTKELMDSTLDAVVEEADRICQEMDLALSKIDLSLYQNQAMIQDYLENSEYLNELYGFQGKPLEEKVDILNRNIQKLEMMYTPVAVEICWSENEVLRSGEIYSIEEMDALFAHLDAKVRQTYDLQGYAGCYDKVMFRIYYQDKDLETGEIRAGNIRTRYDFGDMSHETLSDFLRDTPVYRMMIGDLLPRQNEELQHHLSR